MSKNKNKKTQDYSSFKTENETANEDKELVKYLYDKEIERSKLIVEKSTAAFFFFAVDSGFLAINWKNFFSKDEVFCQMKSSKSPLYLQLANLTGKYEVNCSTISKYNAEIPTKILIGLIVVIASAAILIICSFGFTTKINTLDNGFLTSFTRRLRAKIGRNPKNNSNSQDNKTTLADYYDYLHKMNNKKEKWIFFSYILLAISVCGLLFSEKMMQKIFCPLENPEYILKLEL